MLPTSQHVVDYLAGTLQSGCRQKQPNPLLIQATDAVSRPYPPGETAEEGNGPPVGTDRLGQIEHDKAGTDAVSL